MDALCAQLLLQFYAEAFETSQVFWPWSEDMHVVLIYNPQIIFITFSAKLNFSDIFTNKVNR